jgi:hypothetical protein
VQTWEAPPARERIYPLKSILARLVLRFFDYRYPVLNRSERNFNERQSDREC